MLSMKPKSTKTIQYCVIFGDDVVMVKMLRYWQIKISIADDQRYLGAALSTQNNEDGENDEHVLAAHRQLLSLTDCKNKIDLWDDVADERDNWFHIQVKGTNKYLYMDDGGNNGNFRVKAAKLEDITNVNNRAKWVIENSNSEKNPSGNWFFFKNVYTQRYMGRDSSQGTDLRGKYDTVYKDNSSNEIRDSLKFRITRLTDDNDGNDACYTNVILSNELKMCDSRNTLGVCTNTEKHFYHTKKGGDDKMKLTQKTNDAHYFELKRL